MRHKAGKENETQTKHTGRNIVIAVVVVLAAFCAYAAALVHSVVPEKLRTLDRGRPWRDSQFASTRLSPSRDMSR